MLAILRGIAGLDVVGGDVVEVAPQYDASTAAAQVVAQVLFTLLCLATGRTQDGTAPAGP